VKSPWCNAIISPDDQADVASAMARIAIVLMGFRLVCENLPDILDKRLGSLNGEGS
jgi:hypothetical protein